MHDRSWGKTISYTDGDLHLELSMLRVIDDWLDESVGMISAKVITEGRMVGLQKGSETPRDQWAHQVTAEGLFTILH